MYALVNRVSTLINIDNKIVGYMNSHNNMKIYLFFLI
jgi:hypothetical protein